MDANTIILTKKESTNVTLVSNVFIDYYMPSANGSYVKVFLYLLRCIPEPEREFSLSFLADHLENTEKDIVRALNYWDKLGILSITRNNENAITGISINDLQAPKEQVPEDSAKEPETAVLTPAPITVQKLERPIYNTAEITEMTNNDEIKWLLNIIEIYLERPLKPTDIQLVLYLHETLGFSTDLVMHLYDYCVSKNKKNTAYIEAVALSWASDGIDTVEKAEVSINMHHENYQAVTKAFGLNRSPGAAEKQYIDKWLSAYGFSAEIIAEACGRSLLNTGKPDFKYADKILDNWYKKQAFRLSDIAKLDEVHNSRTAPKTAVPPARPKAASNRFNSFPQRNYSSLDYETLEQKLLQK